MNLLRLAAAVLVVATIISCTGGWTVANGQRLLASVPLGLARDSHWFENRVACGEFLVSSGVSPPPPPNTAVTPGGFLTIVTTVPAMHVTTVPLPLVDGVAQFSVLALSCYEPKTEIVLVTSNMTGADIYLCLPCTFMSYNLRHNVWTNVTVYPETYYPFQMVTAGDRTVVGPTGANVGATVPRPCQVGTYNPFPGQAYCQFCPAGTSNTLTGSKSVSDCAACKAGQYSDTPGLPLCKDCPAGTYSLSVGAFSIDSCTACPPLTASTVVGATNNSVCMNCTVGRISSAGSTVCGPCAAGSLYVIAAGACIPCAAGYYADSVMDVCSECPTGRYQPLNGAAGVNSCQLCEVNTYNPLPAQTAKSACQLCPPDLTNPIPGASSITACQSCRIGQFLANDTCQYCPTGYYLSPISGCEICPAGTYFDGSGATAAGDCTNCPVGRYSAVPAASSSAFCIPCQPGHFGSVAGANSPLQCVLCPPGFIQPLSGQGACLPCPAGTYSAAFGANNCSACPVASQQVCFTAAHEPTNTLQLPAGALAFFTSNSSADARFLVAAVYPATLDEPNIRQQTVNAMQETTAIVLVVLLTALGVFIGLAYRYKWINLSSFTLMFRGIRVARHSTCGIIRRVSGWSR